MALATLKRINSTETNSRPVTPQKNGAAAKPEVQPKPTPAPASSDGLFVPVEQEPPDTPVQRGAISPERFEQFRLQLWFADNLRKTIAPEVPLDMPLERTPEREQLVEQHFTRALAQTKVNIPAGVTQEQFFSNICDEVFSFGPLEPFIKSDNFSEIMVNGPYIIFVEEKGRLTESGHKFMDDDHVERIIKRIVKPLGREPRHGRDGQGRPGAKTGVR